MKQCIQEKDRHPTCVPCCLPQKDFCFQTTLCLEWAFGNTDGNCRLRFKPIFVGAGLCLNYDGRLCFWTRGLETGPTLVKASLGVTCFESPSKNSYWQDRNKTEPADSHLRPNELWPWTTWIHQTEPSRRTDHQAECFTFDICCISSICDNSPTQAWTRNPDWTFEAIGLDGAD